MSPSSRRGYKGLALRLWQMWEMSAIVSCLVLNATARPTTNDSDLSAQTQRRRIRSSGARGNRSLGPDSWNIAALDPGETNGQV